MTALLTDAVRRRLRDAGCIAETSDIYDSAGARFYDELVGPDRSEIREVLAVARRSGPAVLDLAAGSGRISIPLLRIGKSVTALDLSSPMLQLLRDALPRGSACEFVVADMRAFDLGREFDLAVLAATSITLLDRDDRLRLFGAVRRHLAPTGALLLSVPGPTVQTVLRTSAERTISVGSGDTAAVYLQSQQVDATGSHRIVNWMPLPLPAASHAVPVLTTSLYLLDAETVAKELQQAGFLAPEVLPVRTADGDGGADENMLLLHSRVDGGDSRVA